MSTKVRELFYHGPCIFLCIVVFQVAVFALATRCLYRAIYVCFSKPISRNSMPAVDEKQDIKLLWPYRRDSSLSLSVSERASNYDVTTSDHFLSSQIRAIE